MNEDLNQIGPQASGGNISANIAGTPSVDKVAPAPVQKMPNAGVTLNSAANAFGAQQQGGVKSLQSQFQSMMATAKRAISGYDSFSRQPTKQNSIQGFADGIVGQMRQPQSASVADTQSVQSPASGGLFAKQMGITMRGVNGKETAGYDYGGLSVSLPKGIDLNDDDSVRSAVNENNYMVDVFNGIYNDEED